jgi:hypothetical protein
MTKKAHVPADDDVFPPPAAEPVPKRAPAPAPTSSVRVTGCDLVTAPVHELLVHLSGEMDELEGIRRRILRSLHPDDEGTERGLVPDDLHGVLDKLPK